MRCGERPWEGARLLRWRMHVLDAETGQPEQRLNLGKITETNYTFFRGLLLLGDRLFAFGPGIRAFGYGQPLPPPPPIAPMTFVPRTLPTLPLYFESSRSGSGNIWRSLSDGSQRVNVSNSGDDNWDPAPSPDGQWIAFESYRTGTSELWLMRSDGTDPHPLTETRNPNIYNYHPTWSPDSQYIAFASNWDGEHQVWVMKANGSEARPLTSEGRNTDPAWSPDGETIAFVSNRLGNDDIWLMDADGGNPRPLITGPRRESSPAWSPDGCLLAYVLHAPEMGDEWGEIMLVDLGTGLRWRAPYTYWGGNRNPSFSPDGTRMAWASKTDDPGKPKVMVVRLDAGAPPMVIEDAKDPVWAPAAGQF
jgi:Tol biopolymer transport system component